MKKNILNIAGVQILNGNQLKSISGAYNGHGSCTSDNDCPSYSSCDCRGRCISWAGEDYGDGACD